MDYACADSVDQLLQLLSDGFRELGAGDPHAIRRCILLDNRRLIGQRFECEGLRATVSADGNTIEFSGPAGERVKTVQRAAAPEVRKAA